MLEGLSEGFLDTFGGGGWTVVLVVVWCPVCSGGGVVWWCRSRCGVGVRDGGWSRLGCVWRVRCRVRCRMLSLICVLVCVCVSAGWLMCRFVLYLVSQVGSVGGDV